MDSFWNVLWVILITFAFVAYLIVMFTIVMDLFRDRDTNGWVKAIWIFFLIFAPFITALVYFIARGSGMAARAQAEASARAHAEQAYIKQVAGNASPTDQIAQAHQLLQSGAITQQEFDQLKAKAMG